MKQHYLFPAMLLVALLTGCERRPETVQGYLEVDMVYAAPVNGGRIERLAARRGEHVVKGALLCELDRVEPAAAVAEAEANLKKVRADREDLGKGLRPEELEALKSKLSRAEAVVKLARIEYNRCNMLMSSRAVSTRDYDNARLTLERSEWDLAEARHNLEVGKLAARPDRIVMADEAIRSASENLTAARWRLAQRRIVAPCDSIVFDVLMREGEYANQGTAIVALIPLDKLKVRFFLRSAEANRLRCGDHITFRPEGEKQSYEATVDYVSDKPEYTPPVIYSRENSPRLVFMAEAVVKPADAPNLHPGLPVTVRLQPK